MEKLLYQLFLNILDTLWKRIENIMTIVAIAGLTKCVLLLSDKMQLSVLAREKRYQTISRQIDH